MHTYIVSSFIPLSFYFVLNLTLKVKFSLIKKAIYSTTTTTKKVLWKLRKLLIKSQAKCPVCVCVCVWLEFVSVSQHLKQGTQHIVRREHTYFFSASSSARTFVKHGNYFSPSTISRHASVDCRKQQKKRARRGGRERRAAKEGRLIVCQTLSCISISLCVNASIDRQSWFAATWISLGQMRDEEEWEEKKGGAGGEEGAALITLHRSTYWIIDLDGCAINAGKLVEKNLINIYALLHDT